MNYTLCVPHFCVKLKKMKQNKKDDKSITERIKNQYVGGILITSFKLPVLSCSQLLKITGFKNTIYNVLALDRCSTCVTVLIYETKMVTVNYVFLCAFFFLKSGGEGFVGTRQQPMLVSGKKKLFFFFWWNIMEARQCFQKRKKNVKNQTNKKRKRKNI